MIYHPKRKIGLLFEGNSSDITGVNNLSVLVGSPGWTTGKFGRGVLYNVAGGVHGKSSGVSLVLDSGITVCMWLHLSNWSAGNKVFAINDTSYTSHTNGTLYCQIEPTFGLWFGWDWGSGFFRRASVAVGSGAGWHHIAFVASKSSTSTNDSYICVDGIRMTSYTARNLVGSMPNLVGTLITLGGYQYGGAWFLGSNVTLDSFEIFNAALPVSDVRRVMIGQNPISV